MKRTLVVLLFFVVAATPTTAQKSSNTKPPEVVGEWTGTWSIHKVDPNKVPPKGLDCVVVRNGDTWQATFEGECGRPYKYTIKMDGRQAGGVVLFKGTADLGAKDGGVFDWIGRANDTEFIGFYTSGRYTGTFKLARKAADAKKN
jgi:hypothetical protein